MGSSSWTPYHAAIPYPEPAIVASWGCPHEIDGRCNRIPPLLCDPGMKGCVLAGRYVFANEDKNRRLREKAARQGPPSAAAQGDTQG
ncbi:MAG TPA: hypothetical protein PKL28_03275 [Rhodocyclaceae bacterium]|jgi:hypothetical protein|nr:hypothetical protein [Rhodocyclaceae bacterium]HNE44411.1 hypothetical protein [Rhodocyclaceae bacterium]HNL22906.1 hypothetical protein [Rhodocyclaceae bacterium]HNM21598.1 hypothetical protein [Rhodocyclaceae bacterium]HNM80049.1 hypothetical protein [Rhodocyclaceae bacterium]